MKLKDRFSEHGEEGKEFIRIWNAATMRGAQNELMRHFGISLATVYRVRKMLRLPDLMSKDHPGRRGFIKRIKQHYWDGKSSAQVAKIVGCDGEHVLKILRQERVEIHPRHVTSLLNVAPNNGMTAWSFNKEVRKLLHEGMTAKQAAQTLGVSEDTVGKRAKAMGIILKQNHQYTEGGYPCLWCAKIMEKVWIIKGPRKQLFCSNACKSRARELRKFTYAQRHLDRLHGQLKAAWGEEWERRRDMMLKKEEISSERREDALISEHTQDDVRDAHHRE